MLKLQAKVLSGGWVEKKTRLLNTELCSKNLQKIMLERNYPYL